MIPGYLKSEIEERLKGIERKDVSILSCRSVSGGCINSCFHLQASSGNYFLKFNDSARYPFMFEAEAKGLQLLGEAKALPVPGVVSAGEVNDVSFLLLEWIEPGRRDKFFWQNFGSRLAELHKATSDNFGLEYNNYIGSLTQSNDRRKSWIEFFIEERLEPQVKLANEKKQIGSSLVGQFNSLYKRFPQIIPEEKPALLHGDLWSGNFMVNAGGHATLIDPAVYFGHREMDLAMTKFFGGFDAQFYSAYHEAFPLEKGFETRIDIHNLYPLLVHVNLFGGGYVEQVKAIVSRYVSS